MSRTILCLASSMTALASVADTLVVTNVIGITRISNASSSYADGIAADTPHQTGYPSDVGDPIFWLDCANTNGWEIAANGAVSKVPSRTGDRYLTTTKGNVSGFSWGINSPVFDANDAVLGAPVLDFGVKGSSRVLMFNAVGPEGFTTNMLDGASLYNYSLDARAPFLNSEVTLAGHDTVDFGP